MVFDEAWFGWKWATLMDQLGTFGGVRMMQTGFQRRLTK